MSAARAGIPLAIAAASGMALWLATALLSGRREAWDGSAYWMLAYPLAIVLCALLGYLFPWRPWRWALAMFLGQFAALCLRNGELGNLWPLGLILFAILSLPAMAAGAIAARLGRRA